ncbi:Phospholipase D1 [Mortierella sp. AD011]|nr:Phospholipase D1 [Mortierella sp. AD010]KAF9399115.1 Phospholipase D1 [Mortierella sp. AD011]
MTVEVSPTPDDAIQSITTDTGVSSAPESPPAGTTLSANKTFISAAERFMSMGIGKRSLSAPLGQRSPRVSSLERHRHQEEGEEGEDQPTSSDNPLDFNFKQQLTSIFPGHRKSLDSRNSTMIPGSVAHTNMSLFDEDLRMIQLKSVFGKLFKRKKDKKARGSDQAAHEEDLQVWRNIAPLVFQPSAVFMGLSFMIEDKGSLVSGGSTADWNMNVILALVKVVILPYTYTSKDTKVKRRDKEKQGKAPKNELPAKDKEEKEAKEHKRFLIIKVQYGDYLPSWLIERSLDDFVALYEAYNPPISEPPLLNKSLKLPKPPAIIRSRFKLSGKSDQSTAMKGAEGDQENETTLDGNIASIDNAASAFDPKAAPKLTREFQIFLQEMVRYAMYLPDAERMCKFLELSALTLAHVPDGGYQGKEGYLTVVKQKRLMDEGPLTNAVKKVYRKPVSKYFIVRDSFIIVAASHKNTEIQDVILLDSTFQATKCPRHIHTPHSFDIVNSELKFHVRAKSDHRRRQFIESIRKMPSLWKEPKRFNSFAPVRENASAQWLVDGRDYFWNVSKAMEMAKETIYILDWMLSPETLLRRHQRDGVDWSLMGILERKAKEGIKIYIVMYSEVEAAMHLASLRAKKLLRKLCPENIWVQRHGPNLKTAWWAHHEKLVVIDNMIAFIGGLDLCFGRWDTAEHTLIDLEDKGLGHRWPGQDYSNPRIRDFFDLSKPELDSLNRTENPRMPWHDVGLQILGQPSRDVARHFIQRWNFLCRTKPKQKTIPFLLPKPDVHLSKLNDMGLQGTCEVQILRSVSSWSMGVEEPECSILTAYLAAIERAEHFIYIENQFFITSTNVNKTIVHNGIGRALTDRIIKAHKANEKFRVIVVLPLVPGFEGGINTPAATSVRMVMLSIYESICHGKNSIYGRLATAGITKPQKYISFYGLRNWAKFGEKFITEQVYIHAKMMIVDDRVAIIGSANINERSMLGNRDSEIAAVVRDMDYIDSTMNGIPYKVSRFAHTLRMNLMMEHLGMQAGHAHGGGSIDQSEAPFSEFDFVDPVHPAFIEDIWKFYAESNTDIFREMFKCIPDNTVKSWSQYIDFNAQSNVDDPRIKEERTLKDKAMDKILGPTMGEHFKSGGESSSEEDEDDNDTGVAAKRGGAAIRRAPKSDDSSEDEDAVRNRAKNDKEKISNLRTDEAVSPRNKVMERVLTQDEHIGHSGGPQRREFVQRTASALAMTETVRLEMERDLSKVQGHLVVWPLDFLRDEIESHNFCYPKDYNHPINLYT